jgi:tetratricopeptide (TPR) repeat protein
MTAKSFKFPAILLGLTVATLLGTGVCDAQYGQASSPSPAPVQNAPAPKETAKPQKVNKAEEAAYKNVLAAQGADPAMEIQAGEEFVTKYPTSRYDGGVYGMLTTAYFSTGNTDKMFATGAKALELDPNNVDVLALLSMAIPRRAKPSMPDYAQQMKNAETYAHRTIELVPTLEKPATVDDAGFEKAKNDKLALAHSGLGLIDLNEKKNYEDARTELTQAVTLASSPDPVDYYLLGSADAQASYMNGAIAAYEKCAQTGPLTAQCKAREDAVKKDKESGVKLSRD